MHVYSYRAIIIGCLSSVSVSGMTQLIPYTKGHQIAIIHHENEYKLVSPLTQEHVSPTLILVYYTIEEDTVIPCADGYERTIVAVRDGEYTLCGTPLYRHMLTITEIKKSDSHTRTIKTRIIYENKSVALFAILACGLAGIVYKIAQKVQDTYLQSTHA